MKLWLFFYTKRAVHSSVTGFVLSGKNPENLSSIAINFEIFRAPVATCENFDHFFSNYYPPGKQKKIVLQCNRA